MHKMQSGKKNTSADCPGVDCPATKHTECKNCMNAVGKILSDKSSFKNMADKVYEVFQKAKDQKPDVDSITKNINEALMKAGAKCEISRDRIQYAVECMNNKMNMEKEKKVTKDDVFKIIRHFLEEKKAEWEMTEKAK